MKAWVWVDEEDGLPVDIFSTMEKAKGAIEEICKNQKREVSFEEILTNGEITSVNVKIKTLYGLEYHTIVMWDVL